MHPFSFFRHFKPPEEARPRSLNSDPESSSKEGVGMTLQTPFRLLMASLALTLCCVFANAQTVTGSLVGHVEDASGAAVPGARVVATDIDRGNTRETVTNDEGNYTIS